MAMVGTCQALPANHASQSIHKNLNDETPMKTCMQCHVSYSELAKKTEKLNPSFNPHSSHKGHENCTNCHKMTTKSQLICNDCHGFTGPGTEMK